MDSRHGAMRWLAVAWAIAGILGIAVHCAAAGGVTAPPADPRQQMVAALAASGPHPSLGDQAQIWDRSVGTWDGDPRDGETERGIGTSIRYFDDTARAWRGEKSRDEGKTFEEEHHLRRRAANLGPGGPSR